MSIASKWYAVCAANEGNSLNDAQKARIEFEKEVKMSGKYSLPTFYWIRDGCTVAWWVKSKNRQHAYFLYKDPFPNV